MMSAQDAATTEPLASDPQGTPAHASVGGTEPAGGGRHGPINANGNRDPLWLVLGERYGLVIIFIAAIVFFSIVDSANFPTVANWQQIGSTQAVTGLLALAFMLPLVGGDFDVSVGANAIVGSVACAACTSKYHWPLVAAILVPVAIGLIIGAFNGLLVTTLRLNALIATLGTSTVLGGLVIWYSGGVPISSGISPTLLNLGTHTVVKVPELVIVTLVGAILMHYLLTQTPYGRQLGAIGSNRSAARLVGIRVRRATMISFVAAGGLAGLVGVLFVAQQGSANPTADGISTLLPALTVAFLGASAFRPGDFNVPGTIVALLLIAVLVSGLTLLGVADWVSPVCDGVALIAGIGLSAYFKAKRVGGFDI